MVEGRSVAGGLDVETPHVDETCRRPQEMHLQLHQLNTQLIKQLKHQ